MMNDRESLNDRAYRLLLHVLPAEFRFEFGSEMSAVFREQRADVRREHGYAALVNMWLCTIIDIFRMAPMEHWSVLSSDVRYALRTMKANAGFTIVAVLTLGLGIGANTAIFSIVNSVLLEPLPYSAGQRLVLLRQPEVKLGTDDALFSVPEIRDYRQRSRTLDRLVEYHSMTFTLLGKDEAHRVRTGVVSADFFNVFGVSPLLGRSFVAADDRPGAEPVLILSYEFWKETEHGDPGIIGKTYTMNDRTHTVIGVLPPIPQYPNENDVYMPTSSCPYRSAPSMATTRELRMMNVFGVLRKGETLEHCRSDILAIGRQLHKESPASYPENAGLVTTASLLREDLTHQARPLLLLLWGAAAFVLLIACANVANLIMARMGNRQQELMIRAALGAGSGRLLRQLLTESSILALLGSCFGLLFAFGSLQLMKDFTIQITPRAGEISINGGVLLFTILCGAITTIIFGSVAALGSRQDLSTGLKEDGQTGFESGSNILRKLLIIVQIAFSSVLLIGAGLMVRSFTQLMRVETGFRSEKVIAIRMNVNGDRFATPVQRLSLARRILAHLESLPGVSSVAVSSSFPLDRDNQFLGGRPTRFQVEGDTRPQSELPVVDSVRSATPDYFKTLGIQLWAGRTFRESDDTESPPVALINHVLAAKRWGKESPVGKRITLDNGQTWLTVVGVVGDVKEFGLDHETPYQIYRPLGQAPSLGSLVVRIAGDLPGMGEQIRRTLHQTEPQLAIVRMETMEQARAHSVASPRTLMNVFALFAVLALVIAAAGIASMLALWVRQRTVEIGIRMALGATPRDIVAGVIRQGMILALAGLTVGLGVSLAVTRPLAALLFRVHPNDLVTYAGVSAVLLLSAFLACYLPARSAAAIEPNVAFHSY